MGRKKNKGTLERNTPWKGCLSRWLAIKHIILQQHHHITHWQEWRNSVKRRKHPSPTPLSLLMYLPGLRHLPLPLATALDTHAFDKRDRKVQGLLLFSEDPS